MEELDFQLILLAMMLVIGIGVFGASLLDAVKKASIETIVQPDNLNPKCIAKKGELTIEYDINNDMKICKHIKLKPSF